MPNRVQVQIQAFFIRIQLQCDTQKLGGGKDFLALADPIVKSEQTQAVTPAPRRSPRADGAPHGRLSVGAAPPGGQTLQAVQGLKFPIRATI